MKIAKGGRVGGIGDGRFPPFRTMKERKSRKVMEKRHGEKSRRKVTEKVREKSQEKASDWKKAVEGKYNREKGRETKDGEKELPAAAKVLTECLRSGL